jgi:hypothetical protein
MSKITAVISGAFYHPEIKFKSATSFTGVTFVPYAILFIASIRTCHLP